MATKRGKTEQELKQELKQTANKIWLAGLGALSAVGDEGQKLFDTLISRGEEMEKRGERGLADAKQKLAHAKVAAVGAWNQLETVIDDKVAAALNGVGVPTRDEIRTLSKRISDLTAKVEGSTKAARTPRPARKAPAKRAAAKKTGRKR
jgi:poly(hydroxyalkanoate) granule-associated protein